MLSEPHTNTGQCWEILSSVQILKKTQGFGSDLSFSVRFSTDLKLTWWTRETLSNIPLPTDIQENLRNTNTCREEVAHFLLKDFKTFEQNTENQRCQKQKVECGPEILEEVTVRRNFLSKTLLLHPNASKIVSRCPNSHWYSPGWFSRSPDRLVWNKNLIQWHWRFLEKSFEHWNNFLCKLTLASVRMIWILDLRHNLMLQNYLISVLFFMD